MTPEQELAVLALTAHQQQALRAVIDARTMLGQWQALGGDLLQVRTQPTYQQLRDEFMRATEAAIEAGISAEVLRLAI